MKERKALLVIGLTLLFVSGCEKEAAIPEPEPDQRDFHVGLYVCEVKKENRQTKTLLASYVDTIELVKQGPDRMLVERTKNIQLPELKVWGPNAYIALYTMASFDLGQLQITYGHDSAFYEYRGYKLP
ncbi:hypothetical protein BH24BAC1_BH24BAC1_23690 [soil metagenome]